MAQVMNIKTLRDFFHHYPTLCTGGVNRDIRQIMECRYLTVLQMSDENLIGGDWYFPSLYKRIWGSRTIPSTEQYNLRIIASSQLLKLIELLDELNNDSNREDKVFFDSNIIKKNTLYVSITVGKVIYWIPHAEYPSRLLELNIRSFCQLVEVMGAKSITITYNKSQVKSTTTRNNFASMITNIGAKLANVRKKKKHISYELKYPKRSSFSLDSNKILERISKGDFLLVNCNNTNLDFQYLVESRCHHLICEYDNQMTLTTVSNADLEILCDIRTNLSGVNGFNIGYDKTSQSHILLDTRVEFYSIDDVEFINCNMVSSTLFGFELITTHYQKLPCDEFEIIGINNIYRFIHRYLAHMIDIQPYDNRWQQAKQLLLDLDKEHSMQEIRTTLLNYFSQKSSSCDLEIFLQVIRGEMFTPDMIGFCIAMAQAFNSIENQITIILTFLRAHAYVDGFGTITLPNSPDVKEYDGKLRESYQILNRDFKCLVVKKIYRQIEMCEKFRWNDFLQLVHNVKSFVPTQDLEYTDKECFKHIMNNFHISFPRYVFDSQMKNFMKYLLLTQVPNMDDKTVAIILNMTSYDNYCHKHIHNISTLIQYLTKKRSQYCESIRLLEDINFTDKENIFNNIIRLFVNNPQAYVTKKFRIMMKTGVAHVTNETIIQNKENLVKAFFNLPNSMIAEENAKFIAMDGNERKHVCKKFIYRLLQYPHKMPNVDKSSLDNLSYDAYWIKYSTGWSSIELMDTYFPVCVTILTAIARTYEQTFPSVWQDCNVTPDDVLKTIIDKLRIECTLNPSLIRPYLPWHKCIDHHIRNFHKGLQIPPYSNIRIITPTELFINMYKV